MKIVDVFGVDIVGIARVKFWCVRNIEKQISLFVLLEEWRLWRSWKKEKRLLKSSLTKYLNELAAELSLEAPKKERIMERLQDIEKRQDELLKLLDNLQALYKEKSEMTNAASIEEEADGILDRVEWPVM